MRKIGVAVLLGVLAVAATAGAARSADPVPGPGAAAGRKVQIVKLRPLSVKLSGFKPSLVLVVRTLPTRAERRVVMEADGSTLVRLGVDATSCTKRITSIVVTDRTGKRLASIRVPLPECASDNQ